MPSRDYLVSAIVSTYNSELFFRGCLEDLEAQTISDKLEIIVIDSGSQQGERAIVAEFQRRYSNIKYIRTEERETIYQAWNRGVKAASGKYLTNANTDDRHRPDALEALSNYLDSHPEITLVYSKQLMTDEPNKPFQECRVIGQLLKTVYHRNIMLSACFMGPQPMWRRTVHERHGYFDEEFVSAGDYEFWLRMATTELFVKINDVLGLY
ncbi:MAG TPA: glycosyl transferase family 2, partial [Cyanobacteria bacterium UBA8530]|nr:glycosyl transferase family 2 [Cyanobacteria bacterium UBA8530]